MLQFSGLHVIMEKAEDRSSNMKGIRWEKSQARFLSLMPEQKTILSLHFLTNSDHLSMWLSMTSFVSFISSLYVPSPSASPPVDSEADDIVYNISGFVVHNYWKGPLVKRILRSWKKLVSEDSRDPSILLDAKSYGVLTKISADAKVVFTQLELFFLSQIIDYRWYVMPLDWSPTVWQAGATHDSRIFIRFHLCFEEGEIALNTSLITRSVGTKNNHVINIEW